MKRNTNQRQSKLLNSINLLVSGNNNNTRIEYQSTSYPKASLEELLALRNVLEAQSNLTEAQNQLIKIYQNRIK